MKAHTPGPFWLKKFEGIQHLIMAGDPENKMTWRTIATILIDGEESRANADLLVMSPIVLAAYESRNIPIDLEEATKDIEKIVEIGKKYSSATTDAIRTKFWMNLLNHLPTWIITLARLRKESYDKGYKEGWDAHVETTL
jgi:hypothetical protein